MHYFVFITKIQNESTYTVNMSTDLRHEMLTLKSKEYPISATELLYYEHFSNANGAITRNTELRSNSNEQLKKLILTANPFEEDLSLLF